jgi:hypothetical protein
MLMQRLRVVSTCWWGNSTLVKEAKMKIFRVNQRERHVEFTVARLSGSACEISRWLSLCFRLPGDISRAGGWRPWELYDLNVSRESRTSKGRVGPSKAGVNLWGVIETVFLIVCMQPRMQ